MLINQKDLCLLSHTRHGTIDIMGAQQEMNVANFL